MLWGEWRLTVEIFIKKHRQTKYCIVYEYYLVEFCVNIFSDMGKLNCVRTNDVQAYSTQIVQREM